MRGTLIGEEEFTCVSVLMIDSRLPPVYTVAGGLMLVERAGSGSI